MDGYDIWVCNGIVFVYLFYFKIMYGIGRVRFLSIENIFIYYLLIVIVMRIW